MKHARALTAFLALSGLVLAQEPRQEPKPPREMELPGMGGPSDDQKEMVRLFHEVERTLGSIDIELADAGAGRIPVPEGKESGIERLLRSNTKKSDEAVSGIEKILELAEKMNGQSSGQCMKAAMSAKPQDGESPLEKERQRGPTQGEKTPQAPKPEDKQGGDKPQDPQPQPSGQKPDDRGKNPPPGENRPSEPRLDASGAPVAPGSDGDRWGMLPERVQQVFQNQITDDLPLQYRDWIDSYYRRLNTGQR